MNVQEQQLGFIKDIIKLKEENPTHELHFMSCTEFWDDNYGWVAGEITSVRVGVWLVVDDRLFVDEDDIEEYFWENDEIYDEYFEGPYPELDELLGSAKPSIIVKIS